MKPLTHVRYEIVRTLRNRRALGVTLALPLVLFYAIASANRHATAAGISFPVYFMTGMAAYGAMFAVVSPGAHVAADRAGGWTRQRRVTPLRTRTYVIAKVLTAYLAALPTLGLLYLAGASLGVHLTGSQWLVMTGLLLVALAPFVIMGVVLGHLVTIETLAPAVGGLVVFFALFGGAFGSFFESGVLFHLVKLLPSFWLVRSGKAALQNGNWPVEGWIVIAVWTAALVPLAALVYRRDTSRV